VLDSRKPAKHPQHSYDEVTQNIEASILSDSLARIKLSVHAIVGRRLWGSSFKGDAMKHLQVLPTPQKVKQNKTTSSFAFQFTNHTKYVHSLSNPSGVSSRSSCVLDLSIMLPPNLLSNLQW
jgi:hypothetical protein